MNREEWEAHNKKWTIEEFQAWQKEQAAELEAAHEKYQRDVDNAVIKEAMGYIKKGMTIQDVGDMFMQSSIFSAPRNGVFVTKDSLKRTLESIGWKSKAERKKGVEG